MKFLTPINKNIPAQNSITKVNQIVDSFKQEQNTNVKNLITAREPAGAKGLLV